VALVHCLLGVGDLRERELEVEHLAGLDRVVQHGGQQFADVVADERDTAVDADVLVDEPNPNS